MIDNPITNPSIVLREEYDNWAILFNPDTGKAFIINPIGVIIWRSISNKIDIKNTISEIKKNFSEVPENIDKEILNFIDKLHKEDFVDYDIKRVT